MTTDAFAGSQDFARPQSPAVRFFSGFVEGNYLYVISALLVMLACKLLMGSQEIAGSEFVRTLKTLLILQGYELLLLVTAFAIVKRLKYVGDAFTLFVIELVLIFDPTFFSNSFHTMYHTTGSYAESIGVNAACFLLAPVKPLILSRILGVRLGSKTVGAFMAALGTVYLLEFPLIVDDEIFEGTYYYFLAWTPLAVALLLPAAREAASPRTSEHYSPRQMHWLPLLFVIVPIAVTLLHIVESSIVHGVGFYSAHFAAFLLIAPALLLRNTEAGKLTLPRLLAIDAASALAILFALPMLNVTSKTVSATAFAEPALIAGGWAAAITGGAVTVLLLLGWMRHRDRRLLFRAAALVGLAALFGLGKLGFYSWASSSVREILQALAQFASGHATLLFGLAWLAAVVVAYRYRNAFTLLVAGALGVFFLFTSLPEYSNVRLPEIVQALALVAAFVAVKHSEDRSFPAFAVTVATLTGAVRVAVDGGIWQAVFLAADSAFIVFLAWYWRSFKMALFAVGCALGIALRFNFRVLQNISVELVILACGLVVFGAAVFVTFNKQRVLAWIPKLAPVAEIPIPAGVADFSQQPLKLRVPTHFDASAAVDLAPPITVKAPEQIEEPDQNAEPSNNNAALLSSVFIHDPKHGLYISSPPVPLPGELRGPGGAHPGERIVVHFLSERKETPWSVLLTELHAFIRTSLTGEYKMLNYSQIAEISRHFATVYFKGHSGQVIACSGLTPVQAQYLKTGLEAFLAEVAPSRPAKPERSEIDERKIHEDD